MDNERIVLAHEADFAIGELAVYPSTREVARDGVRHVIEPRVMQVLVALHRAGGAVVSKDDLVHSCWEGRVVGEDAINRVIGRLRRLSEEAGKGAFEVETVTRVGYRLHEHGAQRETPPLAARPSAEAPGASRRTVLLGGGVTALVLAAVGGWWLGNRADDGVPDDVRDLVQRGVQAVLYGTPEQTTLGISLRQQASEQAPTSATVWGLLSLAYGQQAGQSSEAEFQQLIAQAESAGRRALELDPENPEAQVGRVFASRTRGQRVAFERAWRDIISRHPDNPWVNRHLAFLLSQVGRTEESIGFLQRTIRVQPFSPTDGFSLAMNLWAAGRLEEADTAMASVFHRWPRHFGVWFSRYKYLAYTNRIEAARAQVENLSQRPTGIPEANFQLCLTELAAFETRAETEIAKATKAHLEAAQMGVGFAQNAMIFAAIVADVDRMYKLADAIYFDRGMRMSQQRYTREQGIYSPSRRRPTYFLFSPPFAPYWKQQRFSRLFEEVGLEDYWRQTRSIPDFRRG